MNKVNDNVPSKLPKPVQDLISLIFNVTTMKNVMMEMEVRVEKCNHPLVSFIHFLILIFSRYVARFGKNAFGKTE